MTVPSYNDVQNLCKLLIEKKNKLNVQKEETRDMIKKVNLFLIGTKTIDNEKITYTNPVDGTNTIITDARFEVLYKSIKTECDKIL